VPKPEVADPEPIDGDYVGMHDGALTLDTSAGGRWIPEGDIGEVKKRLGSHWAEGLAFGAVLDVMVVLLVASQWSRLMGPGPSVGLVGAAPPAGGL
jgi:hypothetical protein